jgi:hypothetical protein
VALVLGDRRQEDDRDVAATFALLDQLRGLEAVEPGHLDVEQDAGEVVAQDRTQGLLARACFDEALTERLEDRLERDEVLVDVVDEQDADAGVVAHVSTRVTAGGQTRP